MAFCTYVDKLNAQEARTQAEELDEVNAREASTAVKEQVVVNNAGKNASRTLTEISSEPFIAAAGINNIEAGSVMAVDKKKDSDLHINTTQMMTNPLDHLVLVAAWQGQLLWAEILPMPKTHEWQLTQTRSKHTLIMV